MNFISSYVVILLRRGVVILNRLSSDHIFILRVVNLSGVCNKIKKSLVKAKDIKTEDTDTTIIKALVSDSASASTNAKKPTLTTNADLTLPDFGSGNFNIIPTPSFYANQSFGKTFGIGATVFANSFGADSTIQKVGSKLLIPQTSTFGLKIDGSHFIPNWTSYVDITDSSKGIISTVGIVWECNFLWKRISYYDTASKLNTNFNPFVIHPKIGLVAAFFNSYINISAYYNFLTVQSENNNFSSFFKTGGKNVFAYPEIDLTSLIDVNNTSKQTIKIEFQLLINNKNTNYFLNSNDNLMPYLKIGFVSKL